MRLHLLKSGPLLALGSLLLFAGAAQAGPIDSASSGLDQAQGCGDPPCAFDVIYNLDASAPVTGDLEITGSTLDFTISLASATLSGSDGAVSSIDFTGVTYSGSFAITLDGSGGATITDQISTISGTVTPDIGGAVFFEPTLPRRSRVGGGGTVGSFGFASFAPAHRRDSRTSRRHG